MAPPAKTSKPSKKKTSHRKPAHTAAGEKHGQRLQKVLAAAGLGSRRQCETLIEEGRVEVDRKVVKELGSRVDPAQQEIRVDGESLTQPKLAYYMLHKPTGVVTTARDPAGRPRVIDLLPPTLGRLFPVGRLDMSSEGLILLTNDGDLANELTHPRYGVVKTYHVQVAGYPDAEVLTQLKRGVYLAEGVAHVVGARIKSRHKQSTILEITLDEGRNREIRRLLAKVGHKVQRLVRTAVGPLKLGELPVGAYRALTREEVQKLQKAAVAARDNQAGRKDDEPAPSALDKNPVLPSERHAARGKRVNMPGNRPGKRVAAGKKFAVAGKKAAAGKFAPPAGKRTASKTPEAPTRPTRKSFESDDPRHRLTTIIGAEDEPRPVKTDKVVIRPRKKGLEKRLERQAQAAEAPVKKGKSPLPAGKSPSKSGKAPIKKGRPASGAARPAGKKKVSSKKRPGTGRSR